MSNDGIAPHLIRTFLSRKHEIAKTRKKQSFVLSPLQADVFVINLFWFSAFSGSEWGFVA